MILTNLVPGNKKKGGKVMRKKLTIMIILILLWILPLNISALNIIEYQINNEKIINHEHSSNDIDYYTNQSLFLEINRIRNRGLLNEIMKIGGSWKKVPIFYPIVKIDNISLYKKHNLTFNIWDTIMKDIRFQCDVEEGKNTSSVEILIFEINTKGLNILRKDDKPKIIINLTYDYRNGRWFGNDSFNDSDGYGHYKSDTFEVWFNIYQNDNDFDGIPNEYEVNFLGTDPTINDQYVDSDNDGCSNFWEWKWGYDPFKWDDHKVLDPDKDGLENIEEYHMAKWFADPYQQDIYVEVDRMDKEKWYSLPHVLLEETKQIVIERFAKHNISLYIDDGWPDGPRNGGGEILPCYEKIYPDQFLLLQFYMHNFAEERRGIFRYLVICNMGSGTYALDFNKYNTMSVATNLVLFIRDHKVTSYRTYITAIASDFMHELGHTLGIMPYNVGGCDNFSWTDGDTIFEKIKARQDFLEEWGDYKSVMNYYYCWNHNVVDYSDGDHGKKGDVNDWSLMDLAFFQKNCDYVE